ncbi:hypothetical protein A2X44_05025 [candidate division CPR3 bacterium GWF2_35_18]|uniref:Glycosyl transferase group 1 n=1 Tax=candidate division CPR3 bacterium GW2011_GWF2_35_18 TaxID=1618350 RepID=A0A0G0BJY0_UNCC3|nr:MAG: Glycosyl transferase group 1 [candidate division CPR3 bacterium GW2011_GWF2_35_18]KKP87260.1 MAG: Glycosyl transferase group 1 [candidate division CPR3 bacterium GW2011_GWE2_35_7]OGB63693.1 MAG: hypothetical protein A2X44_05025 [candidate division CPR3 bacterium GWF2_35_18]OGB64987.1 MAG: hypothetical protein A2250_01020 [candidate division CPR3 bacterium RIFOXYA2_FULL_35_13]OGB78530.1 MAG: hypothetical protein A2296_01910 [candidate division CPR3 bacterium RIFOXYB2_FULL_35_8]OGB79729.
MKVAIVHDFLNQYGGAERVVEAIKMIYPEAPIYTSFFEPEKLPERMRSWQVITPNFKKIPLIRRFSKQYTFLLPLAFESFDLRDYDVIISSTANFAKGIITKPNQIHICYCHTPPRFLYHYETEFNRRKISIYKPFLIFLDHYLRVWDYLAAQRVDYFLTNSYNTQQRIKKFYRRESKVIYPPVELSSTGQNSQYKTQNYGKYFFIVSRLVAYKRIDLAIKACNELNLNLVVAGTGKDKKKLEKLSGKTIKLLGKVSDIELAGLYKNCEGFIFPAGDDFGMTPVEAMLYGKPVIAYGKGGVLESVIPGKTGEFFYENNVVSLKKVLANFNGNNYLKENCQKQAQKFSKSKFSKELRNFVTEKWKEEQNA